MEESVYFSLQLSDHTPPLTEVRAGTQGKHLEIGAHAEVVEGCCLLACSPWIASLLSTCPDEVLPTVI